MDMNDFRPISWDQIVGLDRSRIGEATEKDILKELAKTGRVRILMFIGPPGTGKTSTARVFAASYLDIPYEDIDTHSDYLELNASGERGIDVIRGRVLDFCKIGTSTGKCRIIVFDEADGLTYQAQEALKAIVQDWAKNVIFVFCLNREKRMDYALISRSHLVRFPPLPYEMTVDWLEEQADQVGITLYEGIAMKVVDYYRGDLRKVVNDFLLVYAGHTVTKWMPSKTYAQKIFSAKSPQEKYLELAGKEYIDPQTLLHDLLILNNYKKPDVFASASVMLLNGADPMIAVLYGLSALDK